MVLIPVCRRAIARNASPLPVYLPRPGESRLGRRQFSSATMGHVEQIAGGLEKMPPKSTFFFPKLLSGLVFNSLKTN
jgi:hypothetical protein